MQTILWKYLQTKSRRAALKNKAYIPNSLLMARLIRQTGMTENDIIIQINKETDYYRRAIMGEDTST